MRHLTTRLTTVFGAAALAAAALVAFPPEAAACSCLAPRPGEPHPAVIVEGLAAEQVEGQGDPFEGPADESGPVAVPTAGETVWRFTVDGVVRGPISPGAEIEVHVMSGDSSSCGVDVQPLQADRRFRVGGSYDEPSRSLHLNLCSGAQVTALDGSAPPDPDEVTDPTAVAVLTDEPPDSGGVDGRLVVAGIGAAGAAGAGLLIRARRRAGG